MLKPFNLLILLAVIISSESTQAKEDSKDTDIVCFAAKSKWICAPKDNQQIAQDKAADLLKIQSQNKQTLSSSTNDNSKTDVVVRPLNIPKMQAIDYSDPNPTTQQQNTQTTQTNIVKSKANIKTTDDYSIYWSYQLIGVSTRQAAIKFAQQTGLKAPDLMVIESEHQGNDWFVVLYKLYQDKDSGVKGLSNLPIQIKNPWLRPLKNLTIKSFIENY